MKEIWKMVPSFPLYEASSLGRIRRLPGARLLKAATIRFGGVPLNGGRDKDGRRKVSVMGRTLKVSPLVCEAFNGPRPAANMICMHLDEDCRNDLPTNLAWGTHYENANTPKLKAYQKAARAGEKHPNAKLSNEDVRHIRASKEQATILAARYGVAAAYVRQIKAATAR
jgi:hypothetical protein